jgi:hypothetical protein
MPAELGKRYLHAIKSLVVDSNRISQPDFEFLLMTLVQEAYRAGVVEMQMPIKPWDQRPGQEESNV